MEAQKKKAGRIAFNLYPERHHCTFTEIQYQMLRKLAATSEGGGSINGAIRACVDKRFGLDGKSSNSRFDG